MSIKEMNHYALNEPCSIFDEEALTALRLAGRTAQKVNECITEFNKLEMNTGDALKEQDKKIEEFGNGVEQMISDEVQDCIDNGEFNEAIDKYAGDLQTRLENLFDNAPGGSTTRDLELLDIRTANNGDYYATAGDAVRGQFNSIPRVGSFNPYKDGCININTTDLTISSAYTSMLFYGVNRFIIPAFSASFAHIESNTFAVVWDEAVKDNPVVRCIPFKEYNVKTQYVMFYVNLAANAQKSYSIVPYIGQYTIDGNVVEVMGQPRASYGVPVIAPYSVEFDTIAETVKVNSHIYVWFGNKEYGVPPQTFGYNTDEENTKYLVIDPTTGEPSIVGSKYYDGKFIIVFSFQTNRITNTEFQTLENYIVDGVSYSRTRVATEVGNVVYVDGDNGNDGNNGEAGAPLRTIQKAIDIGARTIKVKPGVYLERLHAKGLDRLSIVADWEDHEEAPHDRPKVIIQHYNEYEGSQDGDGFTQIVCSGTGLMREVFVDHTLPLIANDSVWNPEGYNVTAYAINGNAITRLTPVATRAEVTPNSNTFTWDGEYDLLWCGCDFEKIRIVDGSFEPNTFENIASLNLEDIVFAGNRKDNLALKKVNDATIQNCEFGYSGLGNGLSVINSNVKIYNSRAYFNRNDGFNFHGCGNSIVINSDGFNNYGDGISHHYGCDGLIDGGEWHDNGKGGIASPTYGSNVNIQNATIHSNAYGVLAYADDNELDRKTFIRNCFITENSVGIKNKNYFCHLFNCYLMNANNYETEGEGMNVKINVTEV